MMNQYEQMKRLNLYLQSKYNGYIGLPYEMLKDELMDTTLAKKLKTSHSVSEGGHIYRFYSFEDISEFVVDNG
jgi:hypothetical protein